MATAIQERTIPPLNTLVKFDNPLLIEKHREKSTKDTSAGKVGSAACKIQTSPPTADIRRETMEILNAILPPKEWEEDGQTWIQQVSSFPSTRLDVINLQEQLDMRLQQRQARETGICPVRRELYTQCFDEIIRQVTVNCAERGLLLLRVRDEITMTMAAYQTLYQSSIAFGMRKALQAEQGKEDLIATAEELKVQKIELERIVAELRQKSEQAERRAAELREAEEKKHTEEIQFLKKTNQQLKARHFRLFCYSSTTNGFLTILYYRLNWKGLSPLGNEQSD
ncbi:axonemal dynein light intermediate polypeptide 1 isoform X1 [Venturia canescens]|uniref:axonemal dynein light intermediate polypeptide 1 isoform X1 n=1 Tax=Venturia canescens TaxID=32260 RepID=UPI001C9D360F|nr:axonemal dynein light intermediate polypeptide 1 isoform X1 [Venturia canescens]